MTRLATCQWIAEHANLLLTGSTGVGKTWLSCALAHSACRHGYRAHYLRLPRLWRELTIAKGDGRYPKLLASLAKMDLLVLDDFGLAPLTDEQRRDLLEILEDRHGTRSTVLTSQLPPRSTGMKQLATPHWLTLSWTVSSTMPTKSR